jgi:hypothetical protein
MALRNLRHCRPANPNRQDNLELVLITPKSPPLNPQNFAPHR